MTKVDNNIFLLKHNLWGKYNNNHHQTNESKLLLEIHITYDTKLSFQAQKKEKKNGQHIPNCLTLQIHR